MRNIKKYIIPLFLCMILIFAFYTRKAIGSSTNILLTSATPTSIAQSPADVLRESATAMLQLKTLHVSLVHTKQQSIMLSSVGTPSPPIAGQILLTTNYDGDHQLPDQASFKMTISTKSTFPSSSSSSDSPATPSVLKTASPATPSVLKTAEIVQGLMLYTQDTDGQQWTAIGPPYSVLPTIREQVLILPVNNYINMLAILLPFAQNSDITDHGSETIQGAILHHFTMTLRANALEDLIRLHAADENYTPEAQSLDSATLDVWLDNSTFYVHNMTLKVNTSEDYSKIKFGADIPDTESDSSATPSASSTPSISSTPSTLALTGTVKLAVSLTIAFSKFNQAVSISAPPGAIEENQQPKSQIPSNEQP